MASVSKLEGRYIEHSIPSRYSYEFSCRNSYLLIPVAKLSGPCSRSKDTWLIKGVASPGIGICSLSYLYQGNHIPGKDYIYIETGPCVPHEPLSRKLWYRFTWRHQVETFSALLVICEGNSPVPVNSPHKGQWRGALVCSLICAWTNGWVNNHEAGDLRRNRAHHDVTETSHDVTETFSLSP